MTRTLDVDYLVLGAGASGMAFTDALLDHADPSVRVALVDRRHGAGGHWLGAYPFVRLHQASVFYGVASTLLGGDLQTEGPEAGLYARADQAEICDYYARVLAERMVGPGRVDFLPGCEVEGRSVVDLTTGERHEVPAHCRVVDARYLAPSIPAESPPRFAVGEGARVVPVNDLERLEVDPSQHVVVGSGKTATDAVVRLLGRGVDPDAICWVRPREPWMLDRAVIQPDPAVYLAMVADLMGLAATAGSLDGLFAGLEEAGIMMRVDPAVTPTMAKGPTLGRWELDLLRSVEHVVRLGHVTGVVRGRLDLAGGSVPLADDAVVVDCAADGLRNRPLRPIWAPEGITVQPVRAGFPCFGAALVGYVEATRPGAAADGEKNRLCPPSPLGNTLADWARMNLVGTRNGQAFGAEPDIAAWSQTVALNPARVAPDHPGSPALDDARERLAANVGPGLAGLERLVDLPGRDRP